MMFRSLKAIALAAFVFSPAAVSAQAVKFEVGKIQYEDLKSPQFSTGVTKKSDTKAWLEVEAEIKALAKPEPKDGFLKEMQVRWYVAFDNPNGKGVIMLTRDINYVNIPVDEEVFVSAYLSPSTIKRISGGDRAGKGIVKAVGLEVLYNGRVIETQSTKGELEKWSRATGISRTEDFTLFSKDETPFSVLWYDRYAEIAPKR